jgi:hypothetical protein
MPDLTRFDFHAVRFMNSEDVEEMSDAEVGQYILLLCKAWLMGKDTTLPVDADKLSRYARTDEISEAVLRHFPVVSTEWGERRRNDVLYGEWMEACLRSANGRDKANKRWNKNEPLTTEDNDATAHAAADATAPPVVLQSGMPKPYRTDSTQSEPNQSDSGFSGQGDFRLFKRRFKELVGANLSGDKRTQGDYARFVQQFGGDVVLQCLEDWAHKSGDWAKTIKFPILAFWKVLPEYAETAVDIIEAQKQQEKEKDLAADKKHREEQAQAASTARQCKENSERFAVKEQVGVESVDDFLKG